MNSLSNLKVCLVFQYKHTKTKEVLDEVIDVTRQLLKITPENDSNRTASLDTLQAHIFQRYKGTMRIEDLEETVQICKQVYRRSIDIPVGSSVIYHDSVRQIMYPNTGFNESYAKLHD
jgi:hypothetical protein